jgi:hypothetical protein
MQEANGHLVMTTINADTGDATSITYRVTGFSGSDDGQDDVLHVLDHRGIPFEIIQREVRDQMDGKG